jgi:hypothetical protein
MKQATLVVLLLIGVSTAAAAFAASSSRPTLRVVDRTPVVVRGAGFVADERVSVVLSAGARSTRVVRATQAGAFVVRFKASLGRCSRYSLQAFGSAGSRARMLPRISLDCVASG